MRYEGIRVPEDKVIAFVTDLMIETLIESKMTNSYLLTMIKEKFGWSEEKLQDECKTLYNQTKIRLLSELEASMGRGFDPDTVLKDILAQ